MQITPEIALGLIASVAFLALAAWLQALRALLRARKATRHAEDAMALARGIVERFLPVENWVAHAEQMRQQALAAHQKMLAAEDAKKKEGAAV